MSYEVAYNPIDWSRFPDAPADVVNFIESVADNALKGKLFNEFRKNRNITVEELQGMTGALVPKKREPTDGEKYLAVHIVRRYFAAQDYYAEDSAVGDVWKKWIEVVLMKHRAEEFEAVWSGVKEYKYLFNQLNMDSPRSLVIYLDGPETFQAGFEPTSAGFNLVIKVGQILDWANDEGVANDIHRFSWEEAVAESDRWHAECKLIPGGVYSPTKPENISHTFKDGWTMQKIDTKRDLEVEGNKMNHCVGRGGYWQKVRDGVSEIYSLRDEKNEPWVTIELSGWSQRQVIQIMAHGDDEPDKKLRRRVKEWFSDVMTDAFQNNGGRSVTEAIYDEEFESITYPIWRWIELSKTGGVDVDDCYDTDEQYGFSLCDSIQGDSWKDVLGVIVEKYANKFTAIHRRHSGALGGDASAARELEEFKRAEVASALIALAELDSDKERLVADRERLIEEAWLDMLEIFGSDLPYFNQDFSGAGLKPDFVRRNLIAAGSSGEKFADGTPRGLGSYTDRFAAETGIGPDAEAWKAESFDIDHAYQYKVAYWRWLFDLLSDDENTDPEFTKFIIYKHVLEQVGIPIFVPTGDDPNQTRLKDETGMEFNPHRHTEYNIGAGEGRVIPLFDILHNKILVSEAAKSMVRAAGVDVIDFIRMHATGDHGLSDVLEENAESIREQVGPVESDYDLGDDVPLIIFTQIAPRPYGSHTVVVAGLRELAEFMPPIFEVGLVVNTRAASALVMSAGEPYWQSFDPYLQKHAEGAWVGMGIVDSFDTIKENIKAIKRNRGFVRTKFQIGKLMFSSGGSGGILEIVTDLASQTVQHKGDPVVKHSNQNVTAVLVEGESIEEIFSGMHTRGKGATLLPAWPKWPRIKGI